MNTKEFRLKSKKELNEILIDLYRKKFKLLLEKSSGIEFKNNHILKNLKRNIARVLTIINEKRDNI